MEQQDNFTLLTLVAATVVSMALIPVMIRLAPALGMIDRPDPRKVHAVPIPRVGGVGIFFGALLPLLLWLPKDPLTLSFLLGSAVLFAFGVWDDRKELGHYVKFIGQFIAVFLVVFQGDLYVTHLPFLGMEPISDGAGRAFTVFALVGMINAINHSDGLDGLAGGESLLSLAAIAYLGYSAGSTWVGLVSMATIGGILGFLRYNSHPARVFMGDGGSQFIGFTLGVLAVYLTQKANPALSPALPALFLGLPIVDIIAVFIQRVYHRMNWFRATKNHIHHRLLELGFQHHESVVLIYGIQAFFVGLAVLVPYESDALILGVYLGVCGLVFVLLTWAEHRGLRLRAGGRRVPVLSRLVALTLSARLARLPGRLVNLALVVFALGGAYLAGEVPRDIGNLSLLLAVLMALRLALGFRVWFLFLRLLVFVTLAFVAYLVSVYPPTLVMDHELLVNGFFIVLAVAVVLAIRFGPQDGFQVTPTDFLVGLVLLVVGLMPEPRIAGLDLVTLSIRLAVLFYAAELSMKQMTSRLSAVTLSLLVTLCILAVRGLTE